MSILRYALLLNRDTLLHIPLSRDSMKYCGVVSPFRGVRVYVRSAMDMTGLETALEELMCRVLGDLFKDGIVAKIADDLYCGGNTPDEVLQNWKKVLQALYKCDLRPSSPKTAVGDLVYLYSDCNKTRARERYLVVEIGGAFCNVKNFVGSQLRASYRVKMTECYRVPSQLMMKPQLFLHLMMKPQLSTIQLLH